MKHFELSSNYLKQLLAALFVFIISVPSIMAQPSDPKGLYKLTEIVHQDGKHMEVAFKQYKYCLEEQALMFTYNDPYWANEPFDFTISNTDRKPLRLTGELSKTENKGIQIIGTSDSTFTLRWFNDLDGLDQYLYPAQTNIDEIYELVKDSADRIQMALSILQLKLGITKHRLQGSWKLRGRQQANKATSQYWIERAEGETYQMFSDQGSIIIYANPDFPQANLYCHYMPCTYLSDNAIDLEERTCLIHWFDNNTVSITSNDESGQLSVTVWDRCGLPKNIQKVFGTNIPLIKKDISRFCIDGFKEKYGSQPDSIRLAFETFDFAVDATEHNNAIFPVLMRCGFKDEYTTLKDSLLSHLMRGEMSADEAVGRYIYWFFKNFDRHTNCSSDYFYKMQPETFVDYTQEIPQYAPEPVGCMVDKETYLLRLPSCMGDVPTWEWLKKKEDEFRKSGCKYLILDLRGNVGGSDAYSMLFTEMMCEGTSKADMKTFYMNSIENNRILKKMYETHPDRIDNKIQEEANTTEEGSLINWVIIPKGEEKYASIVRKGAIIIDNFCASAGETPVRMVRYYPQSPVKVYGRERTMGCELSGNCNFIRLPNSQITLQYPMTVDVDFEKACREKKPGHKPDVIIPLPYPKQLTDNIDSWVLWVAKKMKK